MDVKNVIRMREGGHVQRCHCFPHHGSYDVAQHTFHMLLLLDVLHPDPPQELYRSILRHDLFERWTGDSPAAAKQVIPSLRMVLRAGEEDIEEMTGIKRFVTEDPWLKALDELEFLLWCDDQIALGSKIAEMKRAEVWGALLRAWEKLPKEVQQFLEDYKWQRTKDSLE